MIAGHCGVSNRFVGIVREESSVNGSQMQPTARVVARSGTTYTQDTAGIGKSKKAAEPAPEPSQAEQSAIGEAFAATSKTLQKLHHNTSVSLPFVPPPAEWLGRSNSCLFQPTNRLAYNSDG